MFEIKNQKIFKVDSFHFYSGKIYICQHDTAQ